MSILAVIPVRIELSISWQTFKEINGTPMVQRIINNCEKSKLVKKLLPLHVIKKFLNLYHL